MMKRSCAAGILTILFAAIAAAGDRPARKAPWEWTLEERIAARTDAKLAKERIERYRTWVRENEVSLKSAPRSPENTGLADVIEGKHDPALFLPHELFESLIHNGYTGDTWRDFYADQLREAGLPDDFWERLEGVASTYIDLVLKQYQLAEGIKSATTAAERQALNEAQRAMHYDLCRERAGALARAQAEFGPALGRLMYGYTARTKARFSPWPDDGERLAFEARGCK